MAGCDRGIGLVAKSGGRGENDTGTLGCTTRLEPDYKLQSRPLFRPSPDLLRKPKQSVTVTRMMSVKRRFTTLLAAAAVTAGLLAVPAGPVEAWPCPDGSQTCGPTAPTFDPTPGNPGGNTTAPSAPTTTIPGATPEMPQAPTSTTPNDGGNFHVQTPDFGPTSAPPDCILNCTSSQAPTVTQAPTTLQQPPTTGQSTPTSGAQTTAPRPAESSQSSETCKLEPPVKALTYSYQGAHPELAAAAASAWRAGGVSITSGSAPNLRIREVNDPSYRHPGSYRPAEGGQPAEIVVNLAQLNGGGDEAIRFVIAHELGHALGLSDSDAIGSLMNGPVGANILGPQPSDLAALAARQPSCSGQGSGSPQNCSEYSIAGCTPTTKDSLKLCREYDPEAQQVIAVFANGVKLMCRDYRVHILEHFQDDITVKDDYDFLQCVTNALIFGKDWDRSRTGYGRQTNNTSGVHGYVAINPGNNTINTAFTSGDGKDWAGCVKDTSIPVATLDVRPK